MKLNRKYRIDECTSTDPIEIDMVNIYAIKHHLVATNRYLLAIVPCEFEAGDTEGWLPPESLRRARSLTKRKDSILRIKLNEKEIVVGDGDEHKLPRPAYPPKNQWGTFPLVSKIIKDAKIETGVLFRIGLNVDYLLQCANAIGEKKITLTIKSDAEPILIESAFDSTNRAYALLMPLRLPEEKE